MGNWNRERTESAFEPKNPLLTRREAINESSRCIYCYDAPCTQVCPTDINIPQFIKRIQDGNLAGSADTILESNILGYSCSAVCPVEVLCVGSCVYNSMDNPPIAIGRLQHYAMNEFYKNPKIKTQAKPSGHKVALVGGGPASLSCAAYLQLSGVQAVILEKNEVAGGLNATGLAPYKWKLEDNMQEVEFIESLGVEIRTNCAVGKDISSEELLKDYDSIFIGAGLGEDSFVLDTQDYTGVCGAIELIEEIKMKKTTMLDGVKKAIVIGAGNTALDVVQELAHLGVPDVKMVYRRTQKDMSGYQHELSGALKQAVQFVENYTPETLVANDKKQISGVEFSSPEGKQILEADLVVFATGQKKQPAQDWFPEIKMDKRNCIVVDQKTYETSIPNIYAGGDCINGGKEVVNAVADGRQAALHILNKLNVEVQYGRFID